MWRPCLTAGAVAALAVAAPGQWTQFQMKRHDGRGAYLWSYPENWNRGVPNAALPCEIGDDTSRRALHCVIRGAAACQTMELAEHARTEGCTLRVEKGASLTFAAGAVISKDRQSTFYINGAVRCLAPGHTFRVGGPWGKPDANLPSSGRVIVGPSGTLEAWFVGINTNHRARTTPSSPWGPRFYSKATDSEIVVNHGRLIALEGLRISTTQARRPGALRLRGGATFTTRPKARHGVQVWSGVWEIQGRKARIHVGKVEFWGSKFRRAVDAAGRTPLANAVSVLKLAGDGVSTIHAGSVSFVDATVLDVADLRVPAGTYKVIDAGRFEKKNLRLAPGTDLNAWRLEFDAHNGHLLLVRKPDALKRTARPKP